MPVMCVYLFIFIYLLIYVFLIVLVLRVPSRPGYAEVVIGTLNK